MARDQFWEFLVDLSRNQGVTIFISTHFMNEAERCDRISLMHSGKVLTQETPAGVIASRSAKSLEDAFIAYLEDASVNESLVTNETQPEPAVSLPTAEQEHQSQRFAFNRAWAYARREGMEIRRDPIRLAFALLGPIIAMIVMSYGISFDVEHLPFAVNDRDQSPESRAYLEQFRGSRYFEERAPIVDSAALERRLKSGELRLAIEIPIDFGKDLLRARQPQVAVWLDGATPFRGETIRGYVEGVHLAYLEELARRASAGSATALPARIETRFRYNQDFESVFAMVPGVIMLILILIPAMLTAVGVVREKELGSITNLYVTPVSGIEFLLGKQLPYLVIALANFVTLLALAGLLFQVPVAGSSAALVCGTVLYVGAATSFGLLVSTLAKTQVAAIASTTLITIIPAVNFSGFLKPLASQSAAAQWFGYGFPSAYFQQISIGTFSKALGFTELLVNYWALAGFIILFLGAGWALLKTQER